MPNQVSFAVLEKLPSLICLVFSFYFFLGVNFSVCKIFLAEVLSRHLLIFSLMKLVTLERVKIDSLP